MANAKRLKPLILENVTINFRNFAGIEKQYNEAGERNFALFLDSESAAAMAVDGWAIKHLDPRDPDDGDGQDWLKVKVNFKGARPPRIVLVTSRGKQTLDEDTCGLIDFADIEKCDVNINPSYWEVNGKTGIKAYLTSIFVTIREDALDLKYADLEDLSVRHPESQAPSVQFEDLGGYED